MELHLVHRRLENPASRPAIQPSSSGGNRTSYAFPVGQAVADALPTEDRRRVSRRVVRRVLFAGAASVVALAAGGAAYLSQYEPLTPGSGVRGIDQLPARHISVGSRPVYVLRHEIGETLRADVGIHNDGPLAVTVTSLLPEIAQNPQEYPMTEVDGFYAPNDDHVQRFRPVDEGARIEPGESVQFRVEYVFGSCKHYDKGSSAIISQIPVTYTVFGLEKRTEIDLGYDLVLESRGGGEC